MDLKIVETDNGGDLVEKVNDLSVVYGFENMPYLAMFGGNHGNLTPVKRIPTEQSFDWWGNSLFFLDRPGLQFNSLTEYTLSTTALNSSGRITIEEAVKEDLKFMREFATVEVQVSLLGLDKVGIAIKIIKPDNIQQREFLYLWDATLKELTDASFTISNSVPPIDLGVFDEFFDDSFD